MQSIFKIIGFFILLFIFQNPLLGQEDLADDYSFFQKKAQLYQHWLEVKGFGEVLKVDSVHFEKDSSELELYLSVKTMNQE